MVHYNFDCDMTREILLHLFVKVEADGFVVVAMLSDLGPGTLKLWNFLDININNTSFPNPDASTRQICVFVDVPQGNPAKPRKPCPMV